MFARLCRRFGHWPVEVVRHAQIHDIDVGPLEHPRVVGVGIGDTVPSAVRLNTLLRTTDRGDQARLIPCNTSVRAGARLGDEARANNRDVDRSSRHSTSV